jgi:leucyl-tRNA synthetase
MDLRVSGKDLIGNHLTFALYNHAAIWEDSPDMWPRSYYTNGHVMIDNMKMSKSLGNFITMSGGCDEFSTDAVRFGLADAGDGLLDANFDRKVTNAAILNLTKEEIWITEQMEAQDMLRTGDYTDMDKMFDNAMSHCVQECHDAYEKMQYKQALGKGWHRLRKYRDFWRSNCTGLHKDLVMRFIEVQLIMLSPICPHFCEYIWQKLQKMGFPGAKGMIVNASWPKAKKFDYTLNMQFDYIQEVRHLFQKEFSNADKNRKKMDAKKKTNTPEFNSCRVLVASNYLDYQIFVLETLSGMYEEGSNTINPALYRPVLLKAKQYETKKMMDFATMIVKDHIPERGAQALGTNTPFDEISTIKSNLALVIGDVAGVPPENVHIYDVDDPNKDDPKNISHRAIPLSPKIQFFTK